MQEQTLTKGTNMQKPTASKVMVKYLLSEINALILKYDTFFEKYGDDKLLEKNRKLLIDIRSLVEPYAKNDEKELMIREAYQHFFDVATGTQKTIQNWEKAARAVGTRATPGRG